MNLTSFTPMGVPYYNNVINTVYSIRVQYWTEQFEDLLWVCEKNAKLIAVLELFEYVMRW